MKIESKIEKEVSELKRKYLAPSSMSGIARLNNPNMVRLLMEEKSGEQE